MRAALYCRASTSEQHADTQLTELRAYAARRRLTPLEFVDEGASGRRRARHAFDEMMRATRSREVDVVVVARLDRLARSLAHMAQIVDELSELGIELVSLQEALDTSTAKGRAMIGMASVFAALEIDMLRERTRAGVAAARRRGKRIGRPPKLSRCGIDRVRRLRRNGKSVRDIASLLGVSTATVSRAARRHR